MDGNPSEGSSLVDCCSFIELSFRNVSVVTMLIVNSDNFFASAFGAVYQSVGLASMSYSPPSASIPYTQWPTLQSMISAGTRLVTFMDTGADFTSVPYIIDG